MKSFVKTLLLLALFAACKNQPAPPPPSTMMSHKYWVSKDFSDALFARNIADTLSNMPCSELIFISPDTVLLTACLSDAGMGLYKVTGPNSIDIMFEGFEGKASKATYDEKTGVLHLTSPTGEEVGWPTDFVPQEGIDVKNLENVTVNLARKRLAGNYTLLPQKGEAAVTTIFEFHADGTQVGFGDFDKFEPWPAGIGAGFIQNPQRNLMYLTKNGQEAEAPVVGWQLIGDTLRLWDTKDVGAADELPEYNITEVRGTYVKAK